MKNIVVIIVLFLSGLSCADTRQKLKKHIANNDYKYWLVFEKEGLKTSKTIYYFDIKGKWKVFTLFSSGQIEKYYADDIILSESWLLLNDSVINIGGRNYKIEQLNRKEFIYNYNGVETKLVTAPDSLFKTK